MLDLQEFYYACEGNYQDVKARLIKEELIQRLVIKFLDDDTYEKLFKNLQVGYYTFSCNNNWRYRGDSI